MGSVMVVTGAAGFIGSCIVAKLNEREKHNLILVDHYDDANDPKRANLKNKEYRRYFDKKDFLDMVRRGLLAEKVECVLHIGACSSTTLQDAQYFQENNFEYSCAVAEWAMRNHARFIYASSAATYGDGSHGYKDDDASTRACKPLNLYGQSKQKFDEWILERGWQNKVAGLKFFNVFGPNEYHKGDMRSVVAKSYDRVITEGRIGLFKSYTKEYADGDQMRDFIYVKDVVDVVMFFVDHAKVNGIFNVGTGQARTWNDLARAVFTAVGKQPNIEYIDMPEVLRDKYQNFTQADVSKLRQAGYDKPFTSLEAAVQDYAGYLAGHKYW
jgi:ADP-L-glycero-D-manno-heptose 6-epimerase